MLGSLFNPVHGDPSNTPINYHQNKGGYITEGRTVQFGRYLAKFWKNLLRTSSEQKCF
jgi:hypothetical protein